MTIFTVDKCLEKSVAFIQSTEQKDIIATALNVQDIKLDF
jgi:hypothetical protein